MWEARDATRSWPSKLAGWLWLMAWLLLLWVIVSPWRQLGGLVSERLRWLECFALSVPLIIGCTVGRLGRDAARTGSGRCHAGLLRWLLLPPAALTAAALVTMRCMEWRDPIGVAFTAFMAYWAGLDIAFGAYPLMEGGHYSFRRQIIPSGDPASATDVSPWLGG